MSNPHQAENFAARNEKELEELAWAIDASVGKFKLFLARCNYTRLRSQLIERLQELTRVKLDILELKESEKTLFTRIQAELAQKQPDALMVLGLELVTDLEKLLTATNQVREEFQKHFHFPLVIWVNDEIFKKMLRLAPDFESWAISTHFAIACDTLLNEFREKADSLFAQILDLGDERILVNDAIIDSIYLQEIQAALQDRSNTGQEIEPALQPSLNFLLGCDAYGSEDIDTALDRYRQSLNFWQQTQNREKLGVVLFHIGLGYFRRAQREENPDDWKESRRYFQQCIDIFKEANRQDLVAKFINPLGEVLESLEAWEDLDRLAQNSLSLQQRYSNSVRLARAYGFLAQVALNKSSWEDAKQNAQNALKALELAPDDQDWSPHRSLYLLLLAKSEIKLKQPQDAIDHLEKARNIEVGNNPRQYIRILKNLRSLYFEQKKYLEAFQTKLERQSIEQRYGLRAFVGARWIQPRREKASIVTQIGDGEKIAREIESSGRIIDVEHLEERIGRKDYKLIVIYGQSGVGKSSLVNGGLVPKLKQKAIGTRDVLPIAMRDYPTNWVKKLGSLLTNSLAEKGIGKERISSELDSEAAILEQLRQNESNNLQTVLIFDQFEEFFFAYPNAGSRKQFFEFLGKCLEILSLKAVLSLREDYLHYLLECNRLDSMQIIDKDILSRNVLYELGNFTSEDTKKIIKHLTESSNFNLEPALIDELVGDLANGLGKVRPIELQIVGAQLQTENIITLTKYQKRGQKEKLIERYLKEVVEDCGKENHQAAERILYLLTGEKKTRPLKTRTQLQQDLQALYLTSEISSLDLVLQIFVQSGLVLLLPENPELRYQLVHDYLADFIREQQEPLVKQLEQEMKQRKRIEKFAMSSGVAGLALAILTVIAIASARRAQISEIKALTNATEALLSSNRNFDALVEMIKVGERWNKVNSDSAIKIRAWLLQEVYLEPKTLFRERNRLEGHSASVIDLAFSPDGNTLASASLDNTVKLWNKQGQLLHTLTGHSDSVIALAFSPDGNTLASASYDNTVKLWNKQGQLLHTLTGHSDSVYALAFSPDGNTLASASDDKTVILWNFNLDDLLDKGCNWLDDYLITHSEVLEELKECQTEARLKEAALVLVTQGEEQARQGDIDGAIARFRQAQKWNRELKLNPNEKARQLAKPVINQRQARQAVREIELDRAIALLKEAQQLDPDIDLNPDTDIKENNPTQIVAEWAAFDIAELLEQKRIKEAIKIYTEVQKLDFKKEISANSLCWDGSLNGYAKEVIFACEKAVTLAPNDGNIRDSRGLARALTGNIQGAIEDFETFIAQTNDPKIKSQRQRWVNDLRAGKNPFTDKEIESLRQ